MTAEFVIAFFATCAFIYGLADGQAPHGQGARAWGVYTLACLAVGVVVAYVFDVLGLFHLSGINPNAGQRM